MTDKIRKDDDMSESRYSRYMETRDQLRRAKNARRRALRHEDWAVCYYNRKRYSDSAPVLRRIAAGALESAERAARQVTEARNWMKRSRARLVDLMGEDWVADVDSRKD